MIKREVSIGTDVATLLLFHPADLAHREHSPLGWYGYDFAYRRESSAGRLIAWSTGADGGYLVRLTSGPLTAAEQERARDKCDFPLIVRHGRVFLDNSDGLPGDGQMADAETLADQWIEVPDGKYRVTVHAIDQRGHLRDLADYVVVFEPVDSIGGIGIQDGPPLLEPLDRGTVEDVARVAQAPAGEALAKDAAALARKRERAEAPFLWKSEPPVGEAFGALAIPEETAILPGGTLNQPVSEELAEHYYPRRPLEPPLAGPVLAALLEPDRFALTTEVKGRSWMAKQGSRISMRATAAVRIVEVRDDPALTQVRVELVPRPDMQVDEGVAEVFRARLLAEVKPREAAGPADRVTAPSFELERLETLFSAEAVTGWALTHLQMPLEHRLALWASPARERIAGIEALLTR